MLRSMARPVGAIEGNVARNLRTFPKKGEWKISGSDHFESKGTTMGWFIIICITFGLFLYQPIAAVVFLLFAILIAVVRN